LIVFSLVIIHSVRLAARPTVSGGASHLKRPPRRAGGLCLLENPGAASPSGIELLGFFHDAHHVRHLSDRAAHSRIVRQCLGAAYLVQAGADQRLALIARTADRAPGLHDRDARTLLVSLRGFLGHCPAPYASTASSTPASRRRV